MPNVLITGASSGIGKEFAKLFAKDNHDLVLVARNEKALNQLAQELRHLYSIKVVVIATDLSDPQAIDRLIHYLDDGFMSMDILINNAGFATSGAFISTSLLAEQSMLSVNTWAMLALTKALVPRMIERGVGRIVNIASVAAFQPGPYMAVYAASKAFVLSFSQALGEELKGSGITVTTICPGPTQTDFITRSGMSNTRIFNGFYPLMSAKAVAKKSYKALQRGTPVHITGKFNRLIVTAGNLLPRRFSLYVFRFLQNR